MTATQTRPRTFSARTAVKVTAKGGAKQVQVEVEKPLGLQLAQGKNGLKVKSASGNAAKAGIQSGDTVIYTSSFFGDELWPSDKLGFTRSAIQAAPSPVTFVVVKGENTMEPGVPESFKVLVKELQSLGLSVEILNDAEEDVGFGDDGGEAMPRLGINLSGRETRED